LTGTNVEHSQSVLRDRCLRQDAIAQQKALAPKPRAWRASLMGSGPSYQTTGRSGEPIKLKNADTASGEARGGGGRANGQTEVATTTIQRQWFLRCRRRVGGGALAFSRASRRLDRSETGSCAYQ